MKNKLLDFACFLLGGYWINKDHWHVDASLAKWACLLFLACPIALAAAISLSM